MFPSEYRGDEGILLEQYGIEPHRVTVKCNDELFKKYAPKSLSSIAVESKYQTSVFNRILHDATATGFFNYINRATKNVDTLFQNEGNVFKGASIVQFRNDLMLSYKPFKLQIDIYDLISGKMRTSISPSPRLLLETFLTSGKSKKDYESEIAILKGFGMNRPFSFNDFYFSGDTLYAITDHKHVVFRDGDSVITYNLSLVSYLKGELLSVQKLNSEVISLSTSYYVSPNFYLWENRAFVFMNQPQKVYPRNFLASFDPKGKGPISPKLINRPKPIEYENSANFSKPIYYKQWYALPLVGKIFDIASGKEQENIPGFPSMKNVQETKDLKAFIYQFMMTEDFLWLVVEFQKDGFFSKEIHKINRKTKSTQISSIKFVGDDEHMVYFDPLNPDFVIYKDNKSNAVIRKRAFP